jgi:heme-degrading monooxygenase HmoA
VAPVIRRQPGNQQVLLLEPANGSDAFISFSLWDDEAAIKAFEANTEYQMVIARIKEIVAQPPVQAYYTVHAV